MNLLYLKEDNTGSDGGESSEPTEVIDTGSDSNAYCKK